MKFLVFLVVLCFAAGGFWYLYDRHGPGFLKITIGEQTEAQPGQQTPFGPSAGPRSLPAATVIAIGGNVMPWATDLRWQIGLEKGDAALVLIEKAYGDQFDEEGDPFLFRARKEEAGRMLEEALGNLVSLAESYVGNEAALLDIEPMLRKYRAGLEKVPRR
jgi:hypothetical protein